MAMERGRGGMGGSGRSEDDGEKEQKEGTAIAAAERRADALIWSRGSKLYCAYGLQSAGGPFAPRRNEVFFVLRPHCDCILIVR